MWSRREEPLSPVDASSIGAKIVKSDVAIVGAIVARVVLVGGGTEAIIGATVNGIKIRAGVAGETVSLCTITDEDEVDATFFKPYL